ncbi:hypothetical protein K435DRAFT_864364 [Dendrothele bispora CBS 962.96]|uniref:Uncharacterized protein n=1 Tax=Dendrothele bispora (strain CBS 962.96) TaxID=1314807 RepID=A0A4V4HEA2_DENBC|nr:hypothetical protein K435DRAFT_864364 [Dendrothele bispora CBS 962.96]
MRKKDKRSTWMQGVHVAFENCRRGTRVYGHWAAGCCWEYLKDSCYLLFHRWFANEQRHVDCHPSNRRHVPEVGWSMRAWSGVLRAQGQSDQRGCWATRKRGHQGRVGEAANDFSEENKRISENTHEYCHGRTQHVKPKASSSMIRSALHLHSWFVNFILNFIRDLVDVHAISHTIMQEDAKSEGSTGGKRTP